MATIVNIRGTSGSGKTTAVRYVMKKLGVVSNIVSSKSKAPGASTRYRLQYGKRVVGYRLSGGVLVVGRYETACGGCDGIKTQEEIVERVKKFAYMGEVVLFEGLTLGTIYTRYYELSALLKKSGHRFIWAFLDTPIDVCIKRVLKRRRLAGNTKPFNTKHTEAKFRSINSAKQHAITDKERVMTLNGKCAGKQLLKRIENMLHKDFKIG